MAEKKLLTVKEYADAHKISVQSVYKKIKNGSIKEVEKVKGKFYVRVENLIDTGEKIGEQLLNQEGEKFKNGFNESLKTTIDALREQLAAKDAQMESKDEQIAALHSMLATCQEQNNKLSALLEQAHQLANQAQHLQLAEKIVVPQEEQPIIVAEEKNFFRKLFRKRAGE